MPHYKCTENKIHFITDEAFMHLLPPGSAAVSDAEADAIRQANAPAPNYAALRAQAYREESDPLFFQEQRGEVPAGTWETKVQEIRQRYPA